MPIGMCPLALILLARTTDHTYATAGLLVGAYSTGCAIGQPLGGRAADRGGHRTVLIHFGLAFPGALLAVALLVTQGAPEVADAAAAVLAGMSWPPIGACMRAAWPMILSSRELDSTAYALETVLQEIPSIIGPVIVSAVVVATSVATALAVAAACGALGALVYATAPNTRAPKPPEANGPRVTYELMRTAAGMRTLWLTTVALGMSFGAIEVAIPAFTDFHHRQALSGVILAALPVGSLVGGIACGLITARVSPLRLYLVAPIVFLAALGPACATDSFVALGLLLASAGLAVGPLLSATFSLTSVLAPRDMATAFGLLTGCVLGGVAIGNAIAGVSVPLAAGHGGFIAAVMSAAILVLLAWARRRTLDRGSPIPLRCSARCGGPRRTGRPAPVPRGG